jgi:hypothetical protein
VATLQDQPTRAAKQILEKEAIEKAAALRAIQLGRKWFGAYCLFFGQIACEFPAGDHTVSKNGVKSCMGFFYELVLTEVSIRGPVGHSQSWIWAKQGAIGIWIFSRIC